MRPTGKHLGWRRDQPPPTLKAICGLRFRSSRLQAGYSLVEVLMAVGIVVLVYGLIICCYIQCGLRAEWAGYSLAAQSLATEQIEQARSAMWDPAMGTNQITNLNLCMWSYSSSNLTWSGYATNILDVPYRGTNYVRATNFVSVQLINSNNSTNPPVPLYMIRVDTVWPFDYQRLNLYFTNTAATLLAPDNRDPTAL